MTAIKKGAGIMAAKRQVLYRQTGTNLMHYNERYVYGNAVRQPEELPRTKQTGTKGAVRTSSRVIKNRRRALDINPAYVLFLSAVSVCALLICIFYLRLQWEIAGRAGNIGVLQRQLAELTEENDTSYAAAADSADLREIRDKAVNELGMVYALEGHVENYSLAKGYVMQYRDIPCAGAHIKSCGPIDRVE